MIDDPFASAASAEPFVLEAGAPGGVSAAMPAKLRGYYRHPLAAYAPRFGYSETGGERTIKRFVSLGRHSNPPDLPPLDAPARMPEWYRRHFPGRKVPDGIRRAAGQVGEAIAAAAAPDGDSPAPSASARSESTRAAAAPGQGGNSPPSDSAPIEARARNFPAHVEELRRVLDTHLEQLQGVIAEQMPATVTDAIDRAEWARSKAERVDSAQRSYKSSLESLRKAENDLVEWQRAHGQLVDRAEAGQEFARIMRAVHSAVMRLAVKLPDRLAGLLPGEQRRAIEDEVRACFRAMKESGFE